MTTKGFNINSPIFDELFDRYEYVPITINKKLHVIEKKTNKINFNVNDPRDYSDQMYIDIKFKKCEKDCNQCNLFKICILE